jgi:hypothetical protein
LLIQVYDVPDATNPQPIMDASVFLNGMLHLGFKPLVDV